MIRAIFALLFFLNFALGFELLRLSEFKDQNVSGWLVSEKLDGVRAYWDGRNLLSRKGKILTAPTEFLADFPPFALDGELYSGRGEFEKIQSIVMDKTPDIKAWREIKFHVFDVPEASGGLLKRLEILAKFLHENKSENIVIIKQQKVADNAELNAFLDSVIRGGAEGAVVREPNAAYERKRSKNALKVKKFQDAECEVVAINKGTGKYANLMGSVTCVTIGSEPNADKWATSADGQKTASVRSDEQNLMAKAKQADGQKAKPLNSSAQIPGGVKFKIGSGFSDEQRANPPKIGDIITFKYQNLTAKGKPRFPVFLRVRKD